VRFHDLAVIVLIIFQEIFYLGFVLRDMLSDFYPFRLNNLYSILFRYNWIKKNLRHFFLNTLKVRHLKNLVLFLLNTLLRTNILNWSASFRHRRWSLNLPWRL